MGETEMPVYSPVCLLGKGRKEGAGLEVAKVACSSRVLVGRKKL